MPTSIDLRDLIINEATAQGVPPSIALGVAQTESGISQWTQNGGIVTSSAGAQGVFQLMPSTAAGLGVDPTDLNGNISGGIAYLKQLYAKFGNWNDALAAYNWGPGNVSSGNSVPTSVGQYVSNVLNSASSFAAGLLGVGSQPSPAAVAVPGGNDGFTAGILDASVLSLNPGLIAVAAIAVVAAVAYIWD
jgi:soluble lytic murein transglycosylase-like protein